MEVAERTPRKNNKKIKNKKQKKKKKKQKKKKKKKRLIESPNETMRIIHNRFVDYLRRLPVKYFYATGCRLGSSPLMNIQRHRHNRFFYLIDLKRAYSRVSMQKLAGVICQADFSLGGQEKGVENF